MRRVLKIKGWLLSFTVIILALSSLILMALILVFQQKTFWNQRGENSFHHTLKHLNNIEKAKAQRYTTLAWGLYKILPSWSVSKGDSSFQAAILGAEYERNAPILTLNKSTFPLKISGKTYLKGSLILPTEIIEKKFNKVSPTHLELNIDSIQVCPETPPTLPVFNIPVFEHSTPNSLDQDIHFNSFRSNTKTLQIDHDFLLSDSLVGNIIIKSKSTITISKNAFLENVIIDAPKVKIQEGFTGCLQIKTNNLILNQNITLLYPSAIVLKLDATSSIYVPDSFSLNGAFIIRAQQGSEIQLNGSMNGLIQSNQPIKISGQYSGQIICPSIIYQDHFSVNTNLLANTALSDFMQRNSLPFPFKAENQNLKFIKWIE